MPEAAAVDATLEVAASKHLPRNIPGNRMRNSSAKNRNVSAHSERMLASLPVALDRA